MPEEIFDVVDERDRVIGQAPRSEVHARGLLHRAVSIFVFDTAGRLLLQKRSDTKDQFPSRYTSSASGHVDAGESYAEAAARELREELGFELPLEFVAQFAASTEMANEHTALYRLVTDRPPTPDPDEIAGLEFREPDTLLAEVEANPGDFTPPFRMMFRWYMSGAQSA